MGDVSRDGRKWWILASMGAILGVILLDETVVGVALPTIQVDLAMSEVASHWVVNVYMLVLAGIAAAAGKLGDIIGHRGLMTIGLLIFGLASLASGFADSGAWLIAARGIQGAGAAIIFPSSLAMVTIAFPEAQRGMALGIYGSIGTVFLALGPTVGGFLTDDLSWRWIFWINPPIVLVVAAVVLAAWRDLPGAAAKRIDVVGAVLLVLGLSMVVFALMEGPGWGWGDPTIPLMLALGALLLVAFVVVELRKPAPLLDVNLFANPTFAGCNLVLFSAQYSKMAVFVFGALYLQDVLKMSPLMAGVALLPTVAPQVIAAPLAGAAADRF
jgi:EmrB/QacA subfamily drug resistance transporter